ncbi:MAG: type II toxin-antitoxin system RelE/ParE family toxin [Sulfuricurvum sp.]|jgi:phage-related protein|uniref:type II toxin-antitoxin system RelE/ParE family toxin n=1 Tax=Sulfuricurvum sp. TaxID=2025608 RepID=UPI0025F94194|nr:type II toxin-antitoxin system RelE/ParE family toxin [Sulfuricurvum sp.]MCK9372801.1 type II toxin-antitoxin system RelE/ParE family toxin [Sulfuricurvum sp.]
MKWEIEFFNEAVEADTLSFPAKILAKMLHIFEMIQEHGPNLGKPYTDAFGDGLFEIRAKGAEGIGRSFFCYASGKKIIILHSFIKKTQKIPQKEIEIALKRKKEINHD